MTWKELIMYLQDASDVFTITEIARSLDMDPGQMATRIARLRLWGYLRYASKEGKKGRGGYELTTKGIKFIYEKEK